MAWHGRKEKMDERRMVKSEWEPYLHEIVYNKSAWNSFVKSCAFGDLPRHVVQVFCDVHQ